MNNLESIKIYQFRGLRDLELKDLGIVNLFVGINNSGKTSVLEALSIYCHPLDIKTWFSIALQREQGIKISRTLPIEAITWLFTHYSDLEKTQLQKPTIHISSTGLFAVKALIATYEEIEKIQLHRKRIRKSLFGGNEQEFENVDTPISTKGIDLKIEIFEESPSLIPGIIHENLIAENFQLWNGKSYRLPGKSQPSLNTSIVTPSSHRSEIGELLSAATFQSFKSDVVKLLQQMDSNISDIEILLSPGSIDSQYNIYIQHEKLGIAPISTFGDGIRRLFHIALKLASVRGGILLIDELESTIHTEALQNSFKWLVKWCIEMNVQLFATTHSLEAVDALLGVTESDSDLVLYRLEPKESQTKVVRHDGYRLRRLREELGQEVRW
jgi:AAA15 family ATPase/GTPase